MPERYISRKSIEPSKADRTRSAIDEYRRIRRLLHHRQEVLGSLNLPFAEHASEGAVLLTLPRDI